MAAPACPPGWTCNFAPVDPPGHVFDPWWTGPWGVVAGFVAIAALLTLLLTLAWWWHLRATAEDRAHEVAAGRAHELAVEEQRTMQLDSAKGDPEVLKIVREMQRG